jgi:hypothetical protein
MAYVYLISEVSDPRESTLEWVKIGYTQNPPEWRLEANLTRGNPRQVFVAAAFEYEDNLSAQRAEKAGHKHFKDHLHQKEWFQISWNLVFDWYLSQGAKLRESERK